MCASCRAPAAQRSRTRFPLECDDALDSALRGAPQRLCESSRARTTRGASVLLLALCLSLLLPISSHSRLRAQEGVAIIGRRARAAEEASGGGALRGAQAPLSYAYVGAGASARPCAPWKS